MVHEGLYHLYVCFFGGSAVEEDAEAVFCDVVGNFCPAVGEPGFVEAARCDTQDDCGGAVVHKFVNAGQVGCFGKDAEVHGCVFAAGICTRKGHVIIYDVLVGIIRGGMCPGPARF